MKSERGISLIESILALTIAIVIITAIVTAVNSSLKSSSANKNQNLAAILAQEGLDQIRDYKTREYDGLKNNFPTATYCLNDASPSARVNENSCTKIASGGEDEAIFVREVYLNHQGRDARVNPVLVPCSITPATFAEVSVSWSDSKCSGTTRCHTVVLSSCFVNAHALPTP